MTVSSSTPKDNIVAVKFTPEEFLDLFDIPQSVTLGGVKMINEWPGGDSVIVYFSDQSFPASSGWDSGSYPAFTLEEVRKTVVNAALDAIDSVGVSEEEPAVNPEWPREEWVKYLRAASDKIKFPETSTKVKEDYPGQEAVKAQAAEIGAEIRESWDELYATVKHGFKDLTKLVKDGKL